VVKVNHSTLSGDSASLGGGILIDGGTLAITNTIVEDNIANKNGGGINHFGSSSTLTIKDSAFTHNVPNHIAGKWTDQGGNTFHL
jgi:fibronectin-binding autotransporter adhesin